MRSSLWLTLAALRRSRGRTAWSLASLVIVGGLATSLLGVHGLIRDRAARELARFGPNVVLRPADAGALTLPLAWLPDASQLSAWGVESAVAAWPREDGDVAVVAVAGPLPEWSRPGAEASALGLSGRVVAGEPRAETGFVALRVDPARMAEAVEALGRDRPGVRVDVVRSVALTETRVLDRMGAFVLAASLVLVALCGLSFSSTLLAQWLERRGELALMASLGATRRTIVRLVAQELATLALIGGVAGAVAGALAGWIILRRGFAWDGPPWAWPWWSLAAGVAVTLFVAALGGALPLRRALRAEPSLALRDE